MAAPADTWSPRLISSDRFAPLSWRARAYLTDLVVIALAIVLALNLLDLVDPGQSVGRGLVWAGLAFLVLYEPLMVCFAGGTIGHRLAGLVVVRPDGRYLSLGAAILRTAIKTLTIGWVGPFILRTGRRRAPWDLPVDSMVLVRAELADRPGPAVKSAFRQVA